MQPVDESTRYWIDDVLKWNTEKDNLNVQRQLANFMKCPRNLVRLLAVGNVDRRDHNILLPMRYLVFPRNYHRLFVLARYRQYLLKAGFPFDYRRHAVAMVQRTFTPSPSETSDTDQSIGTTPQCIPVFFELPKALYSSAALLAALTSPPAVPKSPPIQIEYCATFTDAFVLN